MVTYILHCIAPIILENIFDSTIPTSFISFVLSDVQTVTNKYRVTDPSHLSDVPSPEFNYTIP
jgi:hypothetical protein